MSEAAKKTFQNDIAAKESGGQLKQALKDFGADVAATLFQKVSQGASELAAALFKGHDGFVLYGPHQGPLSPQHGQEHGQSHELGRER
jgi:hypothetical protein